MDGMMEALVYEGPGSMTLETRPIPVLGQGEVLIRVRVVSICGSDINAYCHASERFEPPLVLGHELAGEIVDIGEGVSGLFKGQRVTVNPMLFCGSCPSCKRDAVNLCQHRTSIGTAIGGIRTDGGMQPYLRIRASAVVPLLEELNFSEGALLEPLSVCFACAKCGYQPDEKTTVVIGAGPIGLMTVKFLKAMGVEDVIVSDVMDTRLKVAREFGASYTVNVLHDDLHALVNELTDGEGADRVIIAAGVPETLNQSLKMARSGGAVVLVALIHEMAEIDPMQIVGRGVKLLGSYMFTTEMYEVMDMLARRKISIDGIVTSTFSLAEGQHALECLSHPNEEIKIQLNLT